MTISLQLASGVLRKLQAQKFSSGIVCPSNSIVDTQDVFQVGVLVESKVTVGENGVFPVRYSNHLLTRLN